MKNAKRLLLVVLCMIMALTCSLIFASCNDDEGDNTACTHEFGEWSVKTAATCLAEGTEERTCSKCSETEERKINKAAHNFASYVSDGNATCLADGTKTATCATEGCNAKDTIADAGSKKAHTFTNYTSDGNATCLADGTKTATCATEGCSATSTIKDEGSKKNHSFTTYISDGNATCLADGSKTAICDYSGCIASDTVADTGSKLEHTFKTYTSNGDATCVSDGTKTAICETAGCNAEDVIDDIGSKLGHLWNVENCTCVEGHYCTRDNCDSQEAALPHRYEVVGGTELSCEVDSTIIYACMNGCGDTFTITTQTATGHKVSEWTYVEEVAGDVACTYVQIYEGICENDNCDANENHVTKEEEVIRHTLATKIVTHANCQNEGDKQDYCTVCTTYTKDYKYSNADAHVWNDGETVGNITTYTCTVTDCSATRTAINASTETTTTVSKDDLANAGEVELKDASIKLDSDTLGALDGNVEISADQLADADLEAVQNQLTPEELAQIGDNPIYDFNMSDANGAVTDFGGSVTIRVPYTLADGEDVESIAVWYLSDDGELVAIQATYDNGYAVFTTTHFSIYTVTRLTPKQRCELYTHAYKYTEVPVSCTSDGYTLRVCQRCGDSGKVDVVKATGHEYEETRTEPKCTEAGSVNITCKNCSYNRQDKLVPTGHSWSVTDEHEATCQSAGYVVYDCDHCDESYKTVLVQKSHSYVDTVTPATCTTGGYTTRVCSYCENTVVTNKVSALGHNHKATVVEKTCSAEGYTLYSCTRCDNSYKTDIVPPSHEWDIEAPTCGQGQVCTVCNAGGLAATGNHTMGNNGVCTVCGTGCKHNFTSVVTDPTCTTGGYTTNTCSICKLTETTNYTAALGHDTANNVLVCARCNESMVPEDFYTNILGSLFEETYTVVIDSIEVQERTFLKNGEITLGLNKEGELTGKGYFRIVTYSPAGSVTVDGQVKITIENDTIYMTGKNANAMFGVSGDIAMEFPVDDILKFITNEVEAPTIPVSVVYDYLLNTLVPFIKNFAKGGEATANMITAKVVSLIATVEYKSGEYVITPNAKKITELNTRLATETLGEFIDKEFGEGSYDQLITFIDATLSKTVGEVLDEASANGADVIELVNSLDALVATVVGAEGVTLSDMMGLEPIDEVPAIQAMLASEELRAMTLEEVVVQVMDMLSSMGGGNGSVNHGCYDKDGNGYCDECGNPLDWNGGNGTVEHECYDKDGDAQCDECGNNGFGGNNHDCYDKDGDAQCDECGNPIKINHSGVAVMNTPNSDAAVGGDAVVEEETEEESKSFREMLVEQLGALRNATLYQIIGAPAEGLDEAVANGNKMIEALFETLSVEITASAEGTLLSIDVAYGDTVSISVVSGYTSSIDYSDVAPEVESATDIIINENYLTGEDVSEYETVSYEIVTDEDGRILTITVVKTRSHVQHESNDGNTITKFVYEEIITTTYDLSVAALMTYKDCGNWSYVSAFAAAESAEEMAMVVRIYSANGTLIDEKYEKTSSENYSGMDDVEFLYNRRDGKLDFASDTMHNYVYDDKSSIEAEGCEGLGERHYFCSVCGEVKINYYTNGHEYETKGELVEGATSCEDGVIVTEYCSVCNKVLHTYEERYHYTQREYIDLTEFGACARHSIEHYYCICGEENEYWFSDWECDACGLMIMDESVRTRLEGCMIKEVRTYTIYVNEVAVKTWTSESIYESHDEVYRLELLPGSKTCEDGVKITRYCAKCDKEMHSYTEYYHADYQQVLVDLSKYGCNCGGYIMVFGCACGEYSNKGYYNINLNCDYEYDCNQENGWENRLENYHCAVTSPACGFNLYVQYNVDYSNPCVTRYTIEIYTLDNEGVKTVIYNECYRTEEHHRLEPSGNNGRIETNLPCVYYVYGEYTCAVDGCGHTENVSSYEVSHSEYEGNVCPECQCGSYSEYSDAGNEIHYVNKYYNTHSNGVSIYTYERAYMEKEGLDGKLYRFVVFERDETVYYDGNRELLEESDSYWYAYNYEYDWSGMCMVHVYYSNSDGENNKNAVDCACLFSNVNIKDPTCTQYGSAIGTCLICGYQGEAREVYPTEHNWYYYGNGFVCLDCGLKNANGSSGEIVLEDASHLAGDDDTLVVGYFYRYGDKIEVIQAITLILENGEEVFIEGVEIYAFGDGNYMAFSKSEVIEAATALGYAEGSYDIRISFVPTNGMEDLDYAITFELMKGEECEHIYNDMGVCTNCGDIVK